MTVAQREKRYWVGVDGGGTKCHAVLFNDQLQPLGQGGAGPANIARQGELALVAIQEAVQAAVDSSGLEAARLASNLSVSAGLAGAFLNSSMSRLKRWQHPYADFLFTSDLHTALLGAHGGKDGVVVITGTGSCVAELHQGSVTQLGGYGFQLGDQASGAWLGQMAVRQALLAADGISNANGLWPAVRKFYDCSTPADMVELLNGAPPAEFARFAPEVFALAASDPAAQAIIQQGADYLNGIISRLLNDRPQLALVFNGGLATLWQPYLTPVIAARIVAPQYGPEWGAVYYARQLFQAD